MLPWRGGTTTAGSSVGRPFSSATQAAGSRRPSRASLAVRPMVVADVDTSTSTGLPLVGMPTPSGLGRTPRACRRQAPRPRLAGAEDISCRTRPASATRLAYGASAPMWWLRRTLTIPTPKSRARCAGCLDGPQRKPGAPGSRRPSQRGRRHGQTAGPARLRGSSARLRSRPSRLAATAARGSRGPARSPSIRMFFRDGMGLGLGHANGQ